MSHTSSQKSYIIRAATIDDIDAIVRHRCEMMREIGSSEDAAIELMASYFKPWLTQKLISGDYLGWVATDANGAVAAGSGLILQDWPPSSLHPAPARRGYLLNVYTEVAHRKQGLAHALTQCAIDWCKENDIPALALHASTFGRPVYESLGFQDSTEMRMVMR